jgi:hypothetical protein
MSINVEILGGSLVVQHYIEEIGEEFMHATLVSNLPNYASAIVTTEEVTAALSSGRPLEQSSSAMGASHG